MDLTLDGRIMYLEMRLAQAEARIAELERHAAPEPAWQATPPRLSPEDLPPHRPPPAPPIDGTWVPVTHKDPHCRRPAFYLTRQHARHERASLQVMRVCPPPERFWREPAVGETPHCSSCDAVIDPWTDADLDWTRALLPVGSRETAFAAAWRGPTPEDPTGRLAALGDVVELSRTMGLAQQPPND